MRNRLLNAIKHADARISRYFARLVGNGLPSGEVLI